MADHSVATVSDVPDAAPQILELFLQRAAEHVTDPSHVQYRFLREALGLENFAISVERSYPGSSPAVATDTSCRRRSTSSFPVRSG
jgi:hypothetical protein